MGKQLAPEVIEKRLIKLLPDKGFTVNICAVDGLACIGSFLEYRPSFSSARAKPSELPASCEPLESAKYSRERDIAI